MDKKDDDIKPWDIKDPWIRTELSVHLSMVNLLKEVCIDKLENILMFCPKCLKFRTFKKIPHIDYTTGKEPIIYQCSDCKKNFVEDAWNPDNSIEKLIKINEIRLSK